MIRKIKRTYWHIKDEPAQLIKLAMFAFALWVFWHIGAGYIQ